MVGSPGKVRLRILLPILLLLAVVGGAMLLVVAPPTAPDAVDVGTDAEVEATDDVAPDATDTTEQQPVAPDGVSELTADPKRAARLFGRVRLYAEREPVAGLALTVTDTDGAALQVTTDADGRFRFPRLPPGVVLELRAEREPYAPIHLTGLLFEPREEHDLGTLWLAQEVELDVVVAAFSGAPIEGAAVAAFATGRAAEVQGGDESTATGAWMLHPAAPTAAATTDAEGRATLRGLMPGSYTIRASADGHSRRSLTDVRLAPDAAERRLRFLLGPGHGIGGTVYDPGGEPVAGVRVAVGDRDTRDAWATESGEDGTYRLDGLPMRPLQVFAARDGATVETYGTLALPGVERFDVHLRPTTSVFGTVADEDGEPLAEAEVQVMVQGLGTAARTTSGEDGTYQVEGVPAAALQWIRASAPGHVRHPDPSAPEQNLGVVLREGEPFRMDLTLRRGLSARVRVVDEADEPLEGVGVTLLLVSRWNAGKAFTATTDGSGTAALDDLVTASYLVRVQAPGRVQPGLPPRVNNLLQAPDAIPEAYRVFVDPETSPVTLEVTTVAGATVSGTVVDATDQPVAGAEITIEGANPQAPVFSDASGAWTMDGVPESSRTTAQAELPTGSTGRSEPFIVEGSAAVSDVEIRLTPTGSVAGRVVTEDGSPPTAAVVRWALGRLQNGGDWVRRRFEQAKEWPVAADGTFEITGIPVPDGEVQVTIRADAPGHLPGSSSDAVVRADEQSGGIQIRLVTAHTVTGRVEGAGGEPVAGATVRHQWRGDGSGDQSNRRRRRQGPPVASGGLPVAQTDAEGRFVLRGVAAGDLQLWAEAPGYASSDRVDTRTGGGEVVIRLQPGLTIAGTVKDESDQPLAGVPVNARRTDRTSTGRWWRGTSQVFTDGEGRFELRDLVEGTYDLTVSARRAWGREINVEDKVEQGVTAGRDDVEIVVKAGRVIEGHVVDADAGPVTGGWIQARPTDGRGGWNAMRWNQVRPDGTFRLTGLAAGTYDLTVHGSFRQAVKEGVAAGTSGVEIEVEQGFSIAGQILDGEGLSLATGFNVRLRRSGTEDWGWQQVVQPGDGRFVVTSLTTGTWDLQFQSTGYAPVVVTDVNVGTDDVRVVMSRGQEFAGTVVDAAGSPIKGAWVNAQQTDAPDGMPPAGGSTRTDDQGNFRLVGLAEGTYRVIVRARGFAQYLATGRRSGTTSERIVMEVGVELAGVAKGATGDPLVNHQLELRSPEGQSMGWARTDAEGRFRFQNVPSGGRWRIRSRIFVDRSVQWLEHDGEVESGATGLELTLK